MTKVKVWNLSIRILFGIWNLDFDIKINLLILLYGT